MGQKNHVVTLNRGRTIDLDVYLRSAKLNPTDLAVASGTLIEGIGNDFSDVDIYIISQHMRTSSEIDHGLTSRVLSPSRSVIGPASDTEVFLMHFPTEYDGIKIDIEFQTFEQVEALSAEMYSIHSYAFKNYILLTKCLSERSMSFIHRVHAGVCLENSDEMDRIKASFDKNSYCYLLYRWNASDYADLLDIIGAWRNREYLRCADLARENMIKQVLAYMCLLGCTDYKRKWILSRINLLPVESNIQQDFATLMAGPGVGDIKDYIRQTVELVDRVFGATSKFFSVNSHPAYPARGEVVRWLNEEIATAVTPYERYEAQYRLKAYISDQLPATFDWLDMEFR